jgi:FixJ family two-component response regulator
VHAGKIVIVEDDPAMGEALQRLLGAAGFSVSRFLSAEDMLDSRVAAEAACLVVDVHLPGISGFELSRRLVQSGNRIRVVFITAHDDEQTRDEAIHAGAEAYFTKPFPGRQLIEVLHSVVSARKVEGSR